MISAAPRLYAGIFQRQYAQHGGVAGSADGHGIAGGQVAGNPVQPFAAHAGALGEAAGVAHAQIPAIEHHAITGFETGIAGFQHHARQVDAGNERIRAHARARMGQRQRVLVIERRVFNLHQDVAIHQVGFIEIDKFGGNSIVGLAGQ
ncbi:hypothetical protein G6F40_015247 [Rhizopus arrhizus]|nr:hypothetical protein G6F40_015247 [Rhizopus arrhizus]